VVHASPHQPNQSDGAEATWHHVEWPVLGTNAARARPLVRLSVAKRQQRVKPSSRQRSAPRNEQEYREQFVRPTKCNDDVVLSMMVRCRARSMYEDGTPAVCGMNWEEIPGGYGRYTAVPPVTKRSRWRRRSCIRNKAFAAGAYEARVRGCGRRQWRTVPGRGRSLPTPRRVAARWTRPMWPRNPEQRVLRVDCRDNRGRAARVGRSSRQNSARQRVNAAA